MRCLLTIRTDINEVAIQMLF